MAMMGSGVRQRQDRARVAAEAAVSSPLLEDINLSGANGILVNVTAGLDLSIGEFQEVGGTVKQFASDDATVVIGTVIDPEMQRRDPRHGGRDRPRSRHAQGRGSCPGHGCRRWAAGPATSSWWRSARSARQRPNYTDLDRPAHQRQQRRSATACGPTSAARTCSTSRRSCGGRPTDRRGVSRERDGRDGFRLVRLRLRARRRATGRRAERQRERDPSGSPTENGKSAAGLPPLAGGRRLRPRYNRGTVTAMAQQRTLKNRSAPPASACIPARRST